MSERVCIKKVYILTSDVKNPHPDRFWGDRTSGSVWGMTSWPKGSLWLCTAMSVDIGLPKDVQHVTYRWEMRNSHGQPTDEQLEVLKPYFVEVDLQNTPNRKLLFAALKLYYNWNNDDLLKYLFEHEFISIGDICSSALSLERMTEADYDHFRDDLAWC